MALTSSVLVAEHQLCDSVGAGLSTAFVAGRRVLRGMSVVSDGINDVRLSSTCRGRWRFRDEYSQV